MFNIGFPELVVILLVAFIVVGPKDLPKVARALARGLKKAKATVIALKKESGWDDMMREVDATEKEIKSTIKELDVTNDVKNVLKNAANDAGLSEDINQIKYDVNELKDTIDFQKEFKSIEDEFVSEEVSETSRNHSR